MKKKEDDIKEIIEDHYESIIFWEKELKKARLQKAGDDEDEALNKLQILKDILDIEKNDN